MPNSIENKVDVKNSLFWDEIIDSMESVVHRAGGTAWRSGLNAEYFFAGKTGTVQVRNITEKEREIGIIANKDLPLKRRDHALFVGFAPYNNPKIALSVVIEHGGSGSKVAAPIAKKIFRKILS